jgi:amino acid transporter
MSQVSNSESLETPYSKENSPEKKSITETTEKQVDVQDGIAIEDGLRRGLLGRHVTLISLASVIGASCFYGFGYALYLSGPLGALIGFSIVGKLGIDVGIPCQSLHVHRILSGP